jgi:hypothetical protein
MSGLRNRGKYPEPVREEFERVYHRMQVPPLYQVPVGVQVTYAGTVAPDGWHLSDGAYLLRNRYPDLFKAIGVTYGAGDGSTTFKLPTVASQIIYTGVR